MIVMKIHGTELGIELISYLLEREFEITEDKYRELSDIALEFFYGDDIEDFVEVIPKSVRHHIPEGSKVMVSPLAVHGEELEFTVYVFYTDSDYSAIYISDEDGKVRYGRIIQ
jgi:hypothetical protein